jgi:leucyl/phenylalanyl-tRNA---protein transferase
MPVFALTDELMFPPPDLAEERGILAVGGDLRPERLLLAYRMGIFPWYSHPEPIIWWSPDPRFVLYPANLKVSRSMRPILNQERFQITYDQAFAEVIRHCKTAPRQGQLGTWITPEMQDAYGELYRRGYAHSVEAWQEEQLVGGLYGVSLGRCFFGESMFAKVSNASKAAFITLVRDLTDQGFALIDCQVYTDHLASLGAEAVPRSRFLRELKACLASSGMVGNWGDMLNRGRPTG